MLRKTLVEVGLSALLVTKEENRIYLSGFHSTNCSLLITPEEDFLLTDFRYESAARQECPQFQVVILDNGRTVGDFLKGLSQIGRAHV